MCLSFSQKQRPKRVKAIYNCVADNPDELTFSEGEVIVVDGEEDQEWWVSISHNVRVCFRILILAHELRLKHKTLPVQLMSQSDLIFTMWMSVRSVTMVAESKKAMSSFWFTPPHPFLLCVLLLFFRLLFLPLWSPLCEH